MNVLIIEDNEPLAGLNRREIVGAKPFVIDELSWADGVSVLDELFAEFAREE